jgi:hypothetical protein
VFKTAASAAEPAPDVDLAEQPVPLSQLSLDLDVPVEGWTVFLAARGIEITLDDIGRMSVARSDARRLFDERRENKARAREVAARQERQAVEADRQWRSQLSHGIPWYEIPDGVLPVVAMTAADRTAQPKRTTPLQEALAGESMTYHRFGPAEDES